MKPYVKLALPLFALPLLVSLFFFSHCPAGSTSNQLIDKAGRGDAAAQVQLATMYKDGQGVKKDYAEAKIIKLEQNYRSANEIVDIANRLNYQTVFTIVPVVECNSAEMKMRHEIFLLWDYKASVSNP